MNANCNRPPRGWVCHLEGNHEGPCPAYPRWWNLCRVVEVDGEAVRVQASGDWTAGDHAAFASIVRAAKAKFAALESPDLPTTERQS